jgi:hypothetical protein
MRLPNCFEEWSGPKRKVAIQVFDAWSVTVHGTAKVPGDRNCAVFRPAGPNRLTKQYTFTHNRNGRKARLEIHSLRVRLLSADLRIPIRRRIGEELTLPAEVAHRFFIDFDAQARPRRNGDVTLNHEVPFVG